MPTVAMKLIEDAWDRWIFRRFVRPKRITGYECAKDVVARYRQSQIKAAVKVNRELLAFYWSLGKDIVELKADSKWGEKFYKTLSADLSAKLPDVRCFSVTNLMYVKYFYSIYSQLFTIWPQLGDKLEETLFTIPWGHHKVLIMSISSRTITSIVSRQTRRLRMS